MTRFKFFSAGRFRMLCINILAMIVTGCLLVWGALAWLDSYTNHGESVKVPQMEGMTIAQAQAELDRAGLKFQVVDSSYIKDMPSGAIISHTPEGGQTVKTGRVIYLTVNSAKVPMKEVPDVANNSSLREAEAKLLATGFKLGEIEYVPEEAREWVVGVKYKDRVLRQGEKVPEGSTLVLLVGAEGLVLSDSAKIYRDTVSGPQTTESQTITEEPEVDDSWFN